MNRLAAHITKIWQNSGQTLCRRECKVEGEKLNVYQVDSRLITRLRYVFASLQARQMDDTNVESLSEIVPPDSVKGMTELRREAFTKVVKIPAIKIPKHEINKTQKIWKPLLLKRREIKPIAELSDGDDDKKTHSLILLDPDKLQIDNLSDDHKILLQKWGLNLDSPDSYEVTLHYNNWTFPEIMKAVLPSDAENVTSFTNVGHIAHLNLKEVTLPYKSLIGEVILDKISTVKTVVNKLSSIDNTYRNFQMELLAGIDNYITQIKEHNCVFELDFSKVYWNSRLAAEHQRIVDLVEKGSIVYDVFAGIGPFAVPLAKKKQCVVFANDLNPSSFEYLKKNIELNKIVTEGMKTFCMDGRDFIKTVVKKDLTDRIVKNTSADFGNSSVAGPVNSTQMDFDADNRAQPHLEVSNENDAAKIQTEASPIDSTPVPCSYVIMNLPAIAIDFLDSFKSLLQDLPPQFKKPDMIRPFLPHIVCYAFSPKNAQVKDFQERVELSVGRTLPDSCHVRIVRNVAPNKEMMCVSFKLWPALVLNLCEDNKNSYQELIEPSNEPQTKRQKLTS